MDTGIIALTLSLIIATLTSQYTFNRLIIYYPPTAELKMHVMILYIGRCRL